MLSVGLLCLAFYLCKPGTGSCFGTVRCNNCCSALQTGMGLQDQNEALEARGGAGGGQELESVRAEAAQRVAAAERKVLVRRSMPLTVWCQTGLVFRKYSRTSARTSWYCKHH